MKQRKQTLKRLRLASWMIQTPFYKLANNWRKIEVRRQLFSANSKSISKEYIIIFGWNWTTPNLWFGRYSNDRDPWIDIKVQGEIFGTLLFLKRKRKKNKNPKCTKFQDKTKHSNAAEDNHLLYYLYMGKGWK